MILHFESHSQNIRFSILFTFDFHFLHHSLAELFHNISPHSKYWYFHSLTFTQCNWTFQNLYHYWLKDVLFYMVAEYHLKTQSSCYFVICNCFNFIIFISDLTAGKCLIEIPFSQRDSDKNQFALWLPHCILVAILFFFPWAFTFSRKLSSYWGREHGPCDRPSLKNPRWFKLLVGCQKESYSDHGEKRHRDPSYIIKEEEAIFLSPPFPFLSFSFFFSSDLMTDNLVPKKSQNNLLLNCLRHRPWWEEIILCGFENCLHLPWQRKYE